MRNSKLGFTMIELLVVLVIIGILAALAVPLYLANTKKARASEAVATMGLLRQAERDYYVNNQTYFDIAPNTVGNIQNPLPPVSNVNTTTGVLTSPTLYGLAVDVGISQYFANSAYTVDAVNPPTAGYSGQFGQNGEPNASDFIIYANGNTTAASAKKGTTVANRKCQGGVTSNCALKGTQVDTYELEMDNSGRIFITYDNGTTWSTY